MDDRADAVEALCGHACRPILRNSWQGSFTQSCFAGGFPPTVIEYGKQSAWLTVILRHMRE
jgi:hypothetical protein